MKILSIQIGSQQSIEARGKTYQTGAFKSPVGDSHFLGTLGLEGDHHEHKEVHGGESRALYAVSLEAYEFWKKHVPPTVDMTYGFFGENVTLESLNEHDIHIGDVFSLGETMIQATMPRFPCFLFESRVQVPGAMEMMFQSTRTGVLFRVQKTGTIHVGDQLKLIKKSEIPVTMPEMLAKTKLGVLTREYWQYLKDLQFYPENMIVRFEKNIQTK